MYPQIQAKNEKLGNLSANRYTVPKISKNVIIYLIEFYIFSESFDGQQSTSYIIKSIKT